MWKAIEPLGICKDEVGKGERAYTIRPGESFHAISGNVHVIEAGEIIVDEPHKDYWHGFSKGDKAFLLCGSGENVFYAWIRGKVMKLGGFWSYPGEKEKHPARLLNLPVAEWRVKVKDYEGKPGWLRVPITFVPHGELIGHKFSGWCSYE